MSLKGSLQTVALPEVLQFLSGTGKSGEFQVSGSHGEGRLWFVAGRISGFDVARAEQPAEALFEMLRLADGEGDFSFSADVDRPEEARASDWAELAPALEAAEERMGQWKDIVRVVPSLDHRVQLKAEAPGGQVILESDQWATVVAIASGRSVGDLIEARHMQEFDGCQAIRVLVEASLVELLEPAVAVEEPTPVVESSLAAGSADGGEELNAGPEAGGFVFSSVEEQPVPSFHVSQVVEVAQDAEGEASDPVDEQGAAADEPIEGFGIPAPLLRFGSEPDAPEEAELEPAAANQVADLDEGEAVFSSFPVSFGGSEAEVQAASYEPVPGPEPEFTSFQSEQDEDHYAALRAAMVEVGENLSPEGEVAEAEAAPETDDETDDAVYELHTEAEMDGRAALHALLSEVTTPEEEEAPQQPLEEPVDGLADRGPWTQRELAAMDTEGAWSSDEEQSNIVPFAPASVSSDANGPDASDETVEDQATVEDEREDGPTDEPINRGLLLKFLSSVRN